MELSKDICGFLEGEGIGCSTESVGAFEVITARLKSGDIRAVLPVEIKARTPEEAQAQQHELQNAISILTGSHGSYPLIITEDRWTAQNSMMKKRLLSHLEIFFPVYARNCEIRRIEKAEAAAFLSANHSYGDAACRYRYGLYLKRHTGHIAQSMTIADPVPCTHPVNPGRQHPEQREESLIGTLIAVATFSNARKWIKGDKTIRSYEWTRYASLPRLRVNGGMGKFLKAFIKDIQPDDIMSYADLEWSEGKVYEQLGFTLDGTKEAVTFEVGEDWMRRPIKSAMTSTTCSNIAGKGHNLIANKEHNCITGKEYDAFPGPGGNLLFRNLGSRKYRLKLTEYE